MKTIELGDSGTQVTQIALGCMQMGTATPRDESFQMLDTYLDAGGSHLDTANCYAWWSSPISEGYESETLLGEWFAKSGRRDRAFLSTKVGGQVPKKREMWAGRDEPDWERVRKNYEGAGRQTIRQGLEGSLRRLQTDHVDLYYIHVDDMKTPLEETLETLAELVDEGKILHVGWSNVQTWRLQRILDLCERGGWPHPVALQQEHSYLRRRAGLEHNSIVDSSQMDFLANHPQMTLVAYSPVLKALYDSEEKRQNHWMMENYRGPDAEARFAVLDRLSGELGVKPSQLVMAWMLHQTNPKRVALIGSRTVEQMNQLLATDGMDLTPEMLESLDSAGA